MRWLSVFLVLLVGSALSAPAFAQDATSPPDQGTDTTPNPGAGASETATENQARRAFLSARDAYAAGRYEEALLGFERALELSQRPALYYNIGLTHDRLRHEQQAVDAYRLYLDSVPEAPERGQLETRIRTIEAEIERDRQRELELEQAREDAANAEATVIVEESDDTALWVGLGAGAAVLVAVGVILAVVLSGGDPEYEGSDFGSVTFVLGAL